MAERKSMSTGHARERPNGKWQLEVDLGYTTNPTTGKRKRNKKYKTIEAKNNKDAQIQLAHFIVEVSKENNFNPQKISFTDFVQNEWIPKCMEIKLAPTTQETYLNALEERIIPAFKYLRIEQVNPAHIVDFLSNLSEDGMRLDGKEGKLSGATIYYYYRVLRDIFKFAVSMQVIERSPVESVAKPKVKKPKITVYDDEEVKELVQALSDELLHWRTTFKLAITTGMRRSELLALDLDKHIDYEQGIVYVYEALTYTKKEGYEIHDIRKGEDSESEGKREIYLSKIVMKDLRALHETRTKQFEEIGYRNLWRNGKHKLLLCHADGHPYNPDTIRTWWIRFLNRHNLTYIKPHALRHTSATLLINKGVHPKIISERLGHANIKTTMNVYGHALKKADKGATDKLDTLFD